jgi:tetratricopeptide (TPR) repeat protein
MKSILKTVLLCFVVAAQAAWAVEFPKAGETGSKLDPALGTYAFAITTDSAEAQAWFNQGLVLAYGFNHGEAIRAFREAAARDPKAAMPWWGIAYANGMHLNAPVMTEAQWKDSFEAAAQARSLLDNESPLERALVEAVSQRTAWPVPEAQRPVDEAYCTAMAKVYDDFGRNPDVATLYAESMMNLQPWDYWTPERKPKGRTAEFQRVIERGLRRAPDHPQLCHLYIHAMEAGPAPWKAERASDTLLHLVPGAGHLVHMPSHIYARIGRYADARTTNEIAVKADDAFFAVGTDPGMYWVYHAHNLHFLAFGAMMEGDYASAIAAANRLETALPEEALDAFAGLIEGVIPSSYHVLIRFGRWADILAKPAPNPKRPMIVAVHHYARGIAHAALGQLDEARAETAAFETAVTKVPGDWWIFANKVHDVLPIARHMLAGELAYREGRLEDAWAALELGIAAEDRLIYDEPPGWMIPVRHAMGALLLEAGDPARAEALYRQDQKNHPGNGWSLLGLQQALEAQDKGRLARRTAKKLDAAWATLSERPTSSCLCAPMPHKP